MAGYHPFILARLETFSDLVEGVMDVTAINGDPYRKMVLGMVGGRVEPGVRGFSERRGVVGWVAM